MKNTKKGISLIVLVITIIVMIILATAIILALSGSGIIGRANQAVEETNSKTEKERVLYAVTTSLAKHNGVMFTVSDLQEELKDATVEESGDMIVVQFVNSNKKYVIDSTGIVTERAANGPWKNNGNGTFTLEKNGQKIEVSVGDNVNYTPSNSGAESAQYTSLKAQNGYTDQTFTASNYTGNWKVFGEDEGYLLLISDVITPDNATHYGLTGIKGYTNSEVEFQKIANVYGKGQNAVLSRCITLDDINKITKYPIEKQDEGKIYAYGNNVIYERVEEGIKYTYTLSNGTKIENTVANPNGYFYYIENNEKKNLSKIGEKINVSANYCSYDITEYTTSDNEKYINMILEGENYWLDYRYSRTFDDYVIWGHLTVNTSKNKVDKNYSMLESDCGPGSSGVYTNAGIRVLVYVDYTELVK